MKGCDTFIYGFGVEYILEPLHWGGSYEYPKFNNLNTPLKLM